MAKDIEIKVKLDTAGAQQQLQDAVQDLEQNPIDIPINIPVEGSIAQLKALKRELKNTAAGSEEFKKLFNQIDDLEEQIGAANKASSDWIDTLAGAGGSLGALGQGLNKGKEAFSSFNNILKTSVIGIIVTAVTLLYQAFSKNEETQRKLQPVLTAFDKILGGLFRAAEPLLDLFITLANKVLPIFASVVSNVAATIAGLARGLGVIGDAIKTTFTDGLSAGFAKAKTAGDAFQQGFNETKNKFIAGSKELTTKEKEEQEKRKAEAEKAAEKRKALLEKQAATAERIAKENADKLAKIEEEKQKRITAFAEEAQDKENAIIAEINKAKLANAEFGLSEREKEINEENRKYQALLKEAEAFGLNSEALTIAHNNKIAEINEKANTKSKDSQQDLLDELIKISEEDVKNELAVAQAKAQINLDYLDGASQLVGIAKSLGEKNKGIQKAALIADGAIGIAKIIISTNTANLEALANPLNEVTFGAYAASRILANNILAGISIASTVAATAKGLSALGGGSAPSGSAPNSGSAGGGSTPLAPQVTLQANSLNSANANTNAQNPTIQNNLVVKAVVSETEITGTQRLVNKVTENAKL